MDYLLLGRVVRVGDRRWRQFVIRDCRDRVRAVEGRWSDDPSGLCCSTGRSTRRSRRTASAWVARRRHFRGDHRNHGASEMLVAQGPCRVPEAAPGVLYRRACRQGRAAAGVVPDTLRKVEAMMSLLILFTEPEEERRRCAAARRARRPRPVSRTAPTALEERQQLLAHHVRLGRGEWRTGYASTAAGAGWERRGSCWRR